MPPSSERGGGGGGGKRRPPPFIIDRQLTAPLSRSIPCYKIWRGINISAAKSGRAPLAASPRKKLWGRIQNWGRRPYSENPESPRLLLKRSIFQFGGQKSPSATGQKHNLQNMNLSSTAALDSQSRFFYVVFKFWMDAVTLKGKQNKQIATLFSTLVLTKRRVRGKQMVTHSRQCFHIQHDGPGWLRIYTHTIKPIGGCAAVFALTLQSTWQIRRYSSSIYNV